MENKVVIGIDNTMDYLNLALVAGSVLREERAFRPVRHPSEVIALETQRILGDNGLSIGDVSCVVVATGPGSFTGIRVGMAFAKGLKAGFPGITLVGVSTLDVLATPLSILEGHYLCPVIDAKKGEVFTCLYHVVHGRVERVSGYAALKPGDIARFVRGPCLVFGTGVRLCEEALGSLDGVTVLRGGFTRPSAELLVREGLRRLEENSETNMEPIYCRRSEAEIKFNVTVA